MKLFRVFIPGREWQWVLAPTPARAVGLAAAAAGYLETDVIESRVIEYPLDREVILPRFGLRQIVWKGESP